MKGNGFIYNILVYRAFILNILGIYYNGSTIN